MVWPGETSPVQGGHKTCYIGLYKILDSNPFLDLTWFFAGANDAAATLDGWAIHIPQTLVGH